MVWRLEGQEDEHHHGAVPSWNKCGGESQFGYIFLDVRRCRNLSLKTMQAAMQRLQEWVRRRRGASATFSIAAPASKASSSSSPVRVWCESKSVSCEASRTALGIKAPASQWTTTSGKSLPTSPPNMKATGADTSCKTACSNIESKGSLVEEADSSWQRQGGTHNPVPNWALEKRWKNNKVHIIER